MNANRPPPVYGSGVTVVPVVNVIPDPPYTMAAVHAPVAAARDIEQIHDRARCATEDVHIAMAGELLRVRTDEERRAGDRPGSMRRGARGERGRVPGVRA